MTNFNKAEQQQSRGKAQSPPVVCRTWREREEKSKKRGHHAPVYLPDGAVYTGNWLNNMRHGRGKLVTRTGIYEGDWQEDKKCGFGTQTDASGRKIYSGEFSSSKRNGTGTYYFSNGDVYSGSWKNDARCGYGTMWYANGSRYDGYWLDNQRHGSGVLLMPNKNRFEGIFRNDKKDGPGKYLFYDSATTYTGEWLKDAAQYGTITHTPITETEYSNPLQLNPETVAKNIDEEFKTNNSKLTKATPVEKKRKTKLPVLELADPQAVLNDRAAAISLIRAPWSSQKFIQPPEKDD